MKNPFKKNEGFGMLFVLKDKESEEKFIECVKAHKWTPWKEESKRIAYSIVEPKGKSKEENASNFWKFIDSLMEEFKFRTPVYMTNDKILVFKEIESK